MGRLVEQPIPYLFNGVSRQPSVVRLPSQVEEAENLSMSVVTGGISQLLPFPVTSLFMELIEAPMKNISSFLPIMIW